MKRIVFLVVFFTTVLPAAVIQWDEALVSLRKEKDPPYMALYVGHPNTRVLRDIRSGAINTHGVVIVDITAKEEVTNPFTNRKITGAQFIAFFGGIVQDYAAGTFFFLDKSGVLQPHMVLPHGIHRNRTRVVELYSAMASSGMSQKLSIAEFGVLNGMKDIANELAIEFRGGKAVDFTRMIKTYQTNDSFLIAATAEGKSINPKTDAAIYVITKDPAGAVFNGQVVEIWKKLTVITTEGAFPPPIVVIGPVGANYPTLDTAGVKYRKAFATEQQLSELRTPMIMLPGSEAHPAQGIFGFLPGEALAQTLDIKITDHTQYNPDIPISDLDSEAGEKPMSHVAGAEK